MKSWEWIHPRYAETDQMGVIHHAVYPIWYELGRVKFCFDAGMPFSQITDRGILLAMVEMNSTFKKPARFGEVYKLATYLKKITSIKMIFGYDLYNEQDELVHCGSTTLAWLDTNLKPLNIQKAHPDIHALFAKLVETSE